MDNETLQMVHDMSTTETGTVINLSKVLSALEGFTDKEKSFILEKLLTMSIEKDKEVVAKSMNLSRLLDNRSQVEKHLKRKVLNQKKTTPKFKEYINDEIKKYQEIIKHIINLSLEDFTKYIENIDSDITNYLILGLEKELVDYQKLQDEAYLISDKESFELIKEDINLLNAKKQILEQTRDTIIVEPENSMCNILFLETTSGRIYFLQDIENDMEVFGAYTRLLKSLQNDNPYKPKHFTLHGINYLVNEMKDINAKIRVFFEKISDNTYIVIGGMRKKSNTGISYFDSLMNRYNYYNQNRSEILKNLHNSEYLERQHNHLIEVKKTLKKQKGDYDE